MSACVEYTVGEREVGERVGATVGERVCISVGCDEGASVGRVVGASVGVLVGLSVCFAHMPFAQTSGGQQFEETDKCRASLS